MSLVSVIIPNYNHADFLAERIESVVNQSYEDMEIIILDDKSTDNSRDIIEKYRYHPKISHIVYNDTNSGSPFMQWKKGVELAKGDYIWIAESDDSSHNNFLEKIVRYLIAEKLSICFANSAYLKDGNFGAVMFEPNDLSSFIVSGNTILKNWFVYKCGVVIGNSSSAVFSKKVAVSVISSSDFFKYRYAGDKAFWLNVLYNSQVGVINEALNYYRIHTDNTSLRKLKNVITTIINTQENIKLNRLLIRRLPLNKHEIALLKKENVRLANQVVNRSNDNIQKLIWKCKSHFWSFKI